MTLAYNDFLHYFCNKVRFKKNLFQASSLLSRDRNQLRTDEVIGGRVRTCDWSSNEANNAANQANQAINPNRRGGRWLIPYQRRKSILMLKDSTLVGNYQQVLFPFKLRLLTTLSVPECHLDLCCVSSCTPDVNQIMFNFLCLAPNTIKNTCGWWLER